ncbi:hypothetical protein V6N13_093084 [Hibiscus sabdariffa]|uniref:Uncharacterized protein n=2 Tax=Hibiscus sabdariffa TaxID=183260 RepID=A0ABR1ZV26_9ROSI
MKCASVPHENKGHRIEAVTSTDTRDRSRNAQDQVRYVRAFFISSFFFGKPLELPLYQLLLISRRISSPESLFIAYQVSGRYEALDCRDDTLETMQ